MRTISAALIAATLIVSAANATPLPAGKPAGVEKAQLGGNFGLLFIGGAVLVGGIVLATSVNGGNGVTTPSTTSTRTTGLP